MIHGCRGGPRAGLQTRVQNLIAAIHRFAAEPRPVWLAFVGAIAVQLLLVLFYVCAARSLAVPFPILAASVIVPISLAVQMVPLSINGFGVREAVFAFFFASLGLDVSSALTLSLGSAMLIMLFSLSGGAVLVLRTRDRRAAATASARDHVALRRRSFRQSSASVTNQPASPVHISKGTPRHDAHDPSPLGASALVLASPPRRAARSGAEPGEAIAAAGPAPDAPNRTKVPRRRTSEAPSGIPVRTTAGRGSSSTSLWMSFDVTTPGGATTANAATSPIRRRTSSTITWGRGDDESSTDVYIIDMITGPLRGSSGARVDGRHRRHLQRRLDWPVDGREAGLSWIG